MALLGVACIPCVLLACVAGDYTVTVYPQYLYQGGRINFDPDRWNGKMGLDTPERIPFVKKTGARTGRWIHPDMDAFRKMPEDPNRKGYPDATYFQGKQFQHSLVEKYLSNLNGYGKQRPIMLEFKGRTWPHWMDCSKYKGQFPNDVDVAVEAFSMLVQAISDATKDDMLPYFEPMNEPTSFMPSGLNWTTIVDVYKLIAQKVKAKNPKLKIGGPAYIGTMTTMDKWDFGKWTWIEEFLDMSLNHLDFFSFHPFNQFHVQGNTYHFSGPNEARLVGTVDMIETYAHLKTGKDVPIIFSAHGLASITGIDVNKQSPLLDWAYINLHNANIFTFLELRGVVDRAVSFLLSYTDLKGQESINYSILDAKKHERDIALGFHLWENLTSSMKFLRADSEFHQAERQVQSHVLVDPSSGTLNVLIHNYDTTQANVRLSFHNGWATLTHVKSTCLYKNSHQMTQLDMDVNVHRNAGHVMVPAEASCFFNVPSNLNFRQASNVHERVHYGNSMTVTIDHNSADMNITLHTNDIQKVEYARLRISVSFQDHSSNPVPKSVKLNGHVLRSYYLLHNPGKGDTQGLWATIEYSVPANILKVHSNDIKMSFAQSGGRVAAIALVVGII